jgi:hypothetical protein
MTLRTNARVAGLAFLVYIATAFPAMILENRATAGEGAAARLANLARHAPDMRIALVLVLIGCFCALVLAVTLYAITRDVDRDLALIVLVCRTAEAVVGGVSLDRLAGRLWLATASGAGAPDPAAANALSAVLLELPDTIVVSASFFAVGSLVFSYLLWHGRVVPVPLAWLGVIASILVVVVLPLQLAGILSGPMTEAVWLPMLAFEVPLGFWLIIKGVASPKRAQPA